LDPLIADAAEFPVDPLASTFTAVASAGPSPILFGGLFFTLSSGQLFGSFYTGLTRDDVGGLRYLLRTNNINREAAGADTITFVTNRFAPQQLFTSNLTEFVEAALTNNAADLLDLFPTLQILSTTPIFTNVVTTDTIFYFTNPPFLPAGSPAVLASNTVSVTNFTIYFNHTFGNAFITPAHQLVSNFQVPIVPGHTTSGGILSVLVTNISTTACPPFVPYGTICTNVSFVPVAVDAVFGDFYIVPDGLCEVSIVATQGVQMITVTNETVVATNAPGTTNVLIQELSLTPTYSYLQYIYVIHPVACPTNTVAHRQGIERVQFVRRDLPIVPLYPSVSGVQFSLRIFCFQRRIWPVGRGIPRLAPSPVVFRLIRRISWLPWPARESFRPERSSVSTRLERSSATYLAGLGRTPRFPC
jgi:hypothetical protein